jgi:proteasome accessory factor B
VAGRDRGRDAVRVFRLSRIEGDVRFSGRPGSVTVPPGADVREVVRTWDSAPAQEHTAVLRIRAGAGYGLRRYATAAPGRPDAPGQPDAPGDVDPSPIDPWDTLTVPYSDTGRFADHVASFGADVVVADPPDLRDAVIRRLKGVLA